MGVIDAVTNVLSLVSIATSNPSGLRAVQAVRLCRLFVTWDAMIHLMVNDSISYSLTPVYRNLCLVVLMQLHLC